VTTEGVRTTPDPYSAVTETTTALLDRLAHANRGPLDAAVEALLGTVRASGLIHVGATGHGLALVLESFYRAGGLACVKPAWDTQLLPLNGARRSTAAERMPDFATGLVEGSGLRAADCLVVVSHSGINPVPVELADLGRRRGATVIAITSRTAGAAAQPRDPEGRRLSDVADVVIDTGAPVGDAAYEAADGERVAPLSTILAVHAWNLLLSGLAERAAAEGVRLPIWRSANVAGGDEQRATLIEAFGERVPSL
jgi:uncharacterized phosphosugar-binding protein